MCIAQEFACDERVLPYKSSTSPLPGPPPSHLNQKMARFSGDIRLIMFILTIIFVILGAILLAVSLYDRTTTGDPTAMGCIGISFTALAITIVAFLTYD